jgi:hypothetical protein
VELFSSVYSRLQTNIRTRHNPVTMRAASIRRGGGISRLSSRNAEGGQCFSVLHRLDASNVEQTGLAKGDGDEEKVGEREQRCR